MKDNTNLRFKQLCILAMLMSAVSAEANIGSGASLDDQARRADIIVIVEAIKKKTCVHQRSYRECTEFYLISNLKGNINRRPLSKLTIITDTNIPEIKTDCCVSGKTYIIYLNKYKGSYFPLLGNRSIYELLGQNQRSCRSGRS